MDNYSYAELTEFYFLTQAAVETQFQYWVTVTFAAVVAGFAARDHLSQVQRLLVASLYLIASVILITRFAYGGITATNIAEHLSAVDAYVITDPVFPLPILRLLLFFAGTGAALFFLARRPGASAKNIDSK